MSKRDAAAVKKSEQQSEADIVYDAVDSARALIQELVDKGFLPLTDERLEKLNHAKKIMDA